MFLVLIYHLYENKVICFMQKSYLNQKISTGLS